MKPFLLEFGLAGLLLGLAAAFGGPRFDAEGVWTVDSTATREARADPSGPALVGTLLLEGRGRFHLEVLEGAQPLRPRSGIWSAKEDGFRLQGGTWRSTLGEPLSARAREDGTVVLEASGGPVVLRRATAPAGK
jgi:hypothetical protein